MVAYFVTGKLGAGKTLSAVGRIRDAFERGAPVATNLDINLKMMLGRHKKNTLLYRLPDKPSLLDLETIGSGNKTYDESKNGLLVLDECGTWFNSRTWNDKSRQLVINWFLHARKLGWDLIFIVQDISIVDKQARLALGEHCVFCRRLDRMQVPIISTLISLLTLGQLRLKFPKLHVGIVKYGDNANSLTVDKWYLMGTGLYSAYDTKQAFSDNYEHGTYSVLPPYYTHGRYAIPLNLRNIMRLTKIHYRKFSRVLAFTFGFTAASLFAYLLYPYFPTVQENEVIQIEQPKPTFDFKGFKIVSYLRAPNEPLYFEIDKSGNRITSIQLSGYGYTFDSNHRCSIRIIKGVQNESITC